MDFETFEEIFNRHKDYNSSLSRRIRVDKFICVEVETGGSTGGNCWGGTSQSYYTHRDTTNQFPRSLSTILEEICPDIKFLKYNNLLSKIDWKIEHTSSGGDYYGNGTEYEVKYCTAKDLYAAMNELDLLND